MTIDRERRDFIQAAGLVAAAASTASLVASPAFSQQNTTGAKTMPYQAKPLSLDPKSIKGLSETDSRQPSRQQLRGRRAAPRCDHRAALELSISQPRPCSESTA